MDSIKQNWPKLAIGATAGIISLFVLYKLFNRQGNPAQTGDRHSQNPLAEILDQRTPVEIRQQQAADFVKNYVTETIGVRNADKGTLSRDEFIHLQRIMTFYAKALLFEKKIEAQEQRYGLLERDFAEYVSTVSELMKQEFDSYNEAVGLVCESAKISQTVFHDTYGKEPIDENAILQELTNQFSSPFKSQRGFSRERAIEMFKNVANLALTKLEDEEVASAALSHDDLVIYFEALTSDFAKKHYNNIGCEEFKASLARYDILQAPEVKDLVERIIKTIARLAPNFNN